MQSTFLCLWCCILALWLETAVAQQPTNEIILKNAPLVSAAIAQATAAITPTSSRTDNSQPSALDYPTATVPSATVYGTKPSVTPTLLPAQELAQNRPSTPTPKTVTVKTTVTGLTQAQLTAIATTASAAAPNAAPKVKSAATSATQSRPTSKGLAPSTSPSNISPSGLGDYIPPRSAASQAHCRQRNTCVTGEFCDASKSFEPGQPGGSCSK